MITLVVVYAVFIDKVPSSSSVFEGMKKEDVHDALGEPKIVLNHLLARMKYGGEVWAYGPDFDFSRIFHLELPVVIRIFGAQPNDMLIIFDADGLVSKVVAP